MDALLIAPFLYSLELSMRSRKAKTTMGSRMPMPNETRQTVLRWFSPAAERTMRNMRTARGPPN